MTLQSMGSARQGADEIELEIQDLAPWFHNLHLPSGHVTAPDHPLGDFPSFKWDEIAPHLPADLSGWSVLDIGCNAGFYTFQLARRGASVTGIDVDEHYLRQARWAAKRFDLQDRVEFRQMQVYDLARITESFDLVLFMGVLYHLRYPLLALDIVTSKTKRMMVFQSLTMPGDEKMSTPDDLDIDQRDQMLAPGWPKMAFIEKSLAGDSTNWWAPDAAGLEAMLRSCGMKIEATPGHEIYICTPSNDLTPYELERRAGELRAATGAADPLGES